MISICFSSQIQAARKVKYLIFTVMHVGINDVVIISLRKEEASTLLKTKQTTCTFLYINRKSSFLCLTNSRVL